MGFFDKFSSASSSRPAKAADYVAGFAHHFQSRVNKLAERLRLCNLPVPKQGAIDYKVSQRADRSDNLTITLPTFTFPPHLTCRLRYDRFCTVVGSEQTIKTIADGLADHNPLSFYMDGIAGDITVGWSNLAPYEILRPYSGLTKTVYLSNRSVDSMIEIFSEKFWLASPLEAYLEKLRTVPPWTIEETQYYEERLKTFIKLTGHYYHHALPKLVDNYHCTANTAVKILPDQVWQSLPSFDYDKYSYPAPKIIKKIIPPPVTRPALMRQFFGSLAELQNPLSFSLIAGGEETIYFELGYEAEDAAFVEQQIGLYFPDYEITETKPFSDLIAGPKPYFFNTFIPLNTYGFLKPLNDFHIDPYRHICEILNRAADNAAYARLEIFCKPLTVAATNAMTDYLTGGGNRPVKEDYGRIIYPDQKWSEETLKLLQKKMPAWGVSVEWKYIGEGDYATVFNNLKTALRQYETTGQQWQQTFYGNWNLISLDELVSLAHFPIAEMDCDRLELASMKTKIPPPLYATGATIIGTSDVRGKIRTVCLPEEVRDRHVYLVGKSGTGKSTLMETVARRDIEAGCGVAVIDPHGDLIRHLLESLPADRIDDCIYFNPVTSPVSLEILAASNEQEIDLLTDDLVTMFRRTSESWGDKMQAILHMTFQTLLRVPGSSFTDITRLLTDKQYRQRVLARINHPTLSSFWEHRYDVRQAEPILIRMDRLTTSGTLRRTLTQHQNSLNFYEIIRRKKIFLADLSKGHLGEATSHLLGSIIVSQIQLAVMRQAQLSGEARVPFSLFVDEVQNFTTGAFSTILSEARKYKLRLTIAHQFVSQLPQDIQKAVFGNVGTLVFFAMSPDDLGAARHELGIYEPSDVANLPKYHAFCRPVTAAKDTFPFATLPPPEIDRTAAEEKITAVINHTQRQFEPPPDAPVQDLLPEVEPEKPVKLPETVTAQPVPVEPEVTETVVPEVTEKVEPVEPEEYQVPAPPAPGANKAAAAERGNSQHRYLQLLVKRIAESRGFQATVEKEVFGGVGRIDVALETETARIAVEISVTNEPDYEVQNIRKCLAAGFAPVIVISAEARHLEKIRRLAEETISPEEFSNSNFFSPEAFHSWLEQLDTEAVADEEKVKGFKVRVQLKPVDSNEQSTRKKAISDVVFGRLKTLKKDDSGK